MHQLDTLAAHDRDESQEPRRGGTSSVTATLPASASSIARAIVRVMRAGAGPVAAGAEPLIGAALAGSGHGLPSSLRTSFEASLGTGLGGVRLHDDDAAHAATAAVGARAFALGDDVFLGTGQYQPDTRDGQWLLAHEVAHTAQQRGGVTAQAKLEVTVPGDRAEVEADRAADAMLTGRPAMVSAAPTALARFPPDGGMDAAVPAEPGPVRAEDVTSQTPPARDWLAEARARAATSGTTQAVPVAAEPPRIDRVLHRDPAVQDGVDRLSPILAAARDSLREATPLFEQLPSDDPAIAGGHNRPMHEVVDGHDDARPIAPGTERAVRGSPAFMSASATLRARGAGLEAAGHHARAALERNVAAQRRVEAVLARQRQRQADGDRATAEASRDTATQGRAGELQDVQNAIRVLELGVGLLAGGVAASSAVAGAGATSITAGQAARTAATNTTAGIASNSMHDLAVGWIAERFVSEHWDAQIRAANERIATAVQTARTAGDQAATHDLAAVAAEARAAEADVTSANQALIAARHEYAAAHHALAAAAGEAAPGPDGRDAASHISATTTAQVRVARLRQLRDAIRAPSADDSRTTQHAFPLWDRHTHRGDELITVSARLLSMRAITERELARWEHRLASLSAQVAHLGREG